ncbi:hypothetical protein MNBD_GAMMA22-1504 [hydrothermal vent metagenome]|uniref:Uncharacterized protein n=1 Tax=hydrothermal vent metagenome TaxID=652676 RepID=A0A3B1AIV8_9ZZZZ
MLERLQANNIPGAIEFLTDVMKSKYQVAFDTTTTNLQTIVQQLAVVEGGSIMGGIAELIVIRKKMELMLHSEFI